MLDNPQVDLMSPKATVLASEKIGKDLFRQVHRVAYFKRFGEVVEAVAVH